MTSQKISQFNVSASLSASDLFTLVVNGTNKNVSFTDFQAALGAIGSIKQVGDPYGAPVLNTPAPNEFNIRNLSSTKGILAKVNAQDGIDLGCNFKQSSGGAELIKSLTSKVYTFRSIKAEAPLQIDIENDLIVIKQTGSPLAQTNTVIVSIMDDFPAPVAGVITLNDDINYIIVQPLTTANRFILGKNNSITANNALSPLFTYTGSGTFFTGVNVNVTVKEIFLSAPSGQVFDISSTTIIGNFFLVDTVIVQDCVKYGHFDNLGTFNVNNSSALITSDGLSFAGSANWNILSLNKFSMSTVSPTFIGVDLGSSVHNIIEITNYVVAGVSGAIGIKGLASSGNLNEGRLAIVSDSEFINLTPLSGIDVEDVRWEFRSNSGLPDSINDGLIHTQGNVLLTAINIIGLAEKVNAVFIDDDLGRFVTDGLGRLTYVGERAARLPIDVTATLLSAGGDKQVSLCVAINGVVKTPTCVQGTASGTKAAALTTIWQYDFSPNDYIEPFVSNDSTTDNLTVTQCVVRVN